jgi:ParB family chromosome partitioning protein
MARLKDLGTVRDSFLIDIDKIKPGKNVRKDFDSVPDLAISMNGMGQLVPISVRLSDDGKTAVICDGERRFRAVQYANKHFGAKINQLLCVAEPREVDDITRILRQIEVNDQSQPLQPMERAEAYQILIKAGWKQVDIAKKVGKSVQTIANTLSLLEAPQAIQDSVRSGKTSASAAARVNKAKPEKKAKAVEKAVKGETVTMADVTEQGTLSAADIKKAIKQIDKSIFNSAIGSQEKARNEGAKWAFEVCLGMHEFVIRNKKE